MNALEATRALRETRMRVYEEAKRLVDDVNAQRRDFSAEESATWKRLNDRIDELDAEIRGIDDRERRQNESAVAREAFERQHGATGAAALDRRASLDLGAWARGEVRHHQDPERSGANAITVDLSWAMREKEAIRAGADAVELRALYSDTGSSGSLVPTTMARTMYEYMESSVAALRMPTTKINTNGGEPMQFPRLAAAGHGSGTQVIAQGTAIGGSDPSFGRMTLESFKYGQLVQVANEVLQDSGIDLAAFLGRDMGRAVGRVLDADLIAGTGSGEPQGMMTATLTGSAGTVATGGSLLTPSYENIVDLTYSVADEYRNPRSYGFLTRDSTAGNLRKLRDGAGGTTGAPLWQPSLFNGIADAGQPDKLLGYSVFTDPNVASLASNARILAVADWNSYYTRIVNPGVVIERDDSFAFDRDVATFRAKVRADGDWIDLTAGNILKMSVS